MCTSKLKYWGFIACLLFFSTTLRAQSYLIGTSNSFTAQGLSFVSDIEHRGEMNIFSLSLEHYGLVSGRTEDIGISLSFSHEYVFKIIEGMDFMSRFYAGLGLSAGFVHDYEKGILANEALRLNNSMGFYAALLCNGGIRFDFLRSLAIDLSFSMLPGIHIHKDNSNGAMGISLYHNGIYFTLMPRLSILYKL